MPSTDNPCIVDGVCASPFNLPEFIDNQACLCGLLNSKAPSPNGNQVELWRCIGNASANIADGGNGKWFNTQLPSEELSGINEPQNWGDNPPDTSKALTLEDKNGKPVYVELSPNGSPNLIGDDKECTGKNDTKLSTKFYGHKNGPVKNSTSSSSKASGSSSSSGSASSMMASSTGAPSASVTSAGAATATSSTPTPSSTKSSATPRGAGLKGILLVGMLLGPVLALTV